MTRAQIKTESVSDMCLAGTVLASCSLTQEVAGLRLFNDKYFLLLNSPNFIENIQEKLHCDNSSHGTRMCLGQLSYDELNTLK